MDGKYGQNFAAYECYTRDCKVGGAHTQVHTLQRELQSGRGLDAGSWLPFRGHKIEGSNIDHICVS